MRQELETIETQFEFLFHSFSKDSNRNIKKLAVIDCIVTQKMKITKSFINI